MAGVIDSDTFNREQYVFMARLSEQTERFEEMAKFMDKMVRSCSPVELTREERNILSAGYKNVVSPLRAAWRILSSIEQKEEIRKNDDHVSLAKDYRAKVENELSQACADIIELLDSYLVPSTSSSESMVFYLKMKGDYNRYLAEFLVGDKRKESIEETMNYYKAAQDIAVVDLRITHPIRLGLALNFSVFHYEILNACDKAIDMAKQAFEEAMAELDNIGEEQFKDSTILIQLLRDNIGLWTDARDNQLDEP